MTMSMSNMDISEYKYECLYYNLNCVQKNVILKLTVTLFISIINIIIISDLN